MNSETRICQNCRQNFTIEPEDFDFYKKINVPAPTFCPECRFERRLAWRNERSLYHRKCDATGKDIITMFAPDVPRVVYERDYWWSDKWDQLESGRNYDFSRPFFEQFSELMTQAPLPNLANNNVVNSPYGNHNADCKNCYWTFAVYGGENLHYTGDAGYAKDSMDLHAVLKSERCYDDVLCGGVSRVAFSLDSDDSVDSDFLMSCKDANNCLAGINLRNKSYYIFNKPYSKQDYQIERAKFDFGSYKALEDFRKRFSEFKLKYPHRYATFLKSINVTGDQILNSKNLRNSFDIFGDVQDSKYVAHALGVRDCYDTYGAGANLELSYEVVDCGINGSQNKFALFVHECRNVDYVYACFNSSNLFGCVGLRSKQYCILNKQYSKEEYETLLPKIKEHMMGMPFQGKNERVYQYGDFFPHEISPFAYNETIAQEFFRRSKLETEAKGYLWREPEQKQHTVTIEPEDLPDHIKDAQDEMLNKVVRCAHKGECEEQCTGAFKMIPDELAFYRRYQYPLPRLCPNCRHYGRRKRRNPYRLWKRQCMCDSKIYKNQAEHHHGSQKCANEFETSYSPEREEIVYCEQCYQQEVI